MISLLVLILLATLIYWKVIMSYNYWSDRGVKQKKQIYLFGDTASLVLRKQTIFDCHISWYNYFPNDRYAGIYLMMKPALLIRDIALIKQIAVDDFDYFVNHDRYVADDIDTLWSKTLYALKDRQWRNMRATLSPSFTSSKMKIIFSLVSECAETYINYFLKMRDMQEIELRDVLTRFANDGIATVAYGIKCDSMNNKNNNFYKMGLKTTQYHFCRLLVTFCYVMAPRLSKILRMKLFPSQVANFFLKIIEEAVKHRQSHASIRPHMINLLLEAKDGRKSIFAEPITLVDAGFATAQESDVNSEYKPPQNILSDMDIAAQAMVFLFGGFETVSSLMCFMLYELTLNQSIQKKLQVEIDATLKECNHTLTYEALMKMRYMDMVLCETLRKWPYLGTIDRVCTKPYTIKPTRPSEKPIHLKVGDLILIPINGLHYDPKYFSNPQIFDPERFSEENRENIIPYTYLPFGLGPRNCIGSRFALLETKTMIFYLLSKFDLVVTDRTEIPIKLSRSKMLATDGMWVGLKRRT